MSLYCASCWSACPDDADTCDCGGKLIAESVHRERRDAEADHIEQMFEAYHAKDAEPNYAQAGFLRVRRAS